MMDDKKLKRRSVHDEVPNPDSHDRRCCGVRAFASGCTDLKPIQAQIDDLNSQVAKLSSEEANIKSLADAAAGVAHSAGAEAQRAQATADSANSSGDQKPTGRRGD